MDGHVESVGFSHHVDVPVSNFVSAEQAALMKKHRLGFVGENLADPLKRDQWYERLKTSNF